VQFSEHYHTVRFENNKKPRLGYNQAEANLNTLNHPIQQSEYAFYTSGNAYIANRQPIQTNQINELNTPTTKDGVISNGTKYSIVTLFAIDFIVASVTKYFVIS
jgi:hypothetical protein